MRARLHMVLAGVAMLAGCATGPFGSDAIVPAPAEAGAAAERAGMPPADVARAADLYALKCARCHKFYDPAAYDAAEWRRWMGKMSKKSKLNFEEDLLLNRYLNAYRMK
jgi:hypothetical protein